MSHPQLQDALEQLMVRAPSALFKRARRLYLDKYPLDGRDCSSALRLFVAEEQVEESVEPDPERAPQGKIAVVTIRPTRLALVHWQQNEAASEQMCSDYLQNTWSPTLLRLTASNNIARNLTPQLDGSLQWDGNALITDTPLNGILTS